jgi:hypothetical protein
VWAAISHPFEVCVAEEPRGRLFVLSAMYALVRRPKARSIPQSAENLGFRLLS